MNDEEPERVLDVLEDFLWFKAKAAQRENGPYFEYTADGLTANNSYYRDRLALETRFTDALRALLA